MIFCVAVPCQIGRSFVISKLKDYPKFRAVAIAIQRSGFKVCLFLLFLLLFLSVCVGWVGGGGVSYFLLSVLLILLFLYILCFHVADCIAPTACSFTAI